MSQAISGGQARSLIGSFTVDTPWDEIVVDIQPFIEMPPLERGKRFATFIRNGCRVIIGDIKSLVIDRSKPFNPTEFIGSGITIWRGPVDGKGLEGEEEQDSRSLTLTTIFLADFRFEHMLKGKETSITGEEKLRRHLDVNHIRPDAKIAQTLYEEPGQVTLEFLHKNFGISWMEFPGTTLRRSGGYRYFLYLDRGGVGRWGWRYSWLDNDRIASNPSVVFASPQVSVSQI